MTYVVHRLLLAVLTAYIVVTVVFFALHIVPGDPAMLLLSGGGSIVPPEEMVQQVRAKLGLDDPIVVQYLRYLGHLLTGDFGLSFRDDRPVMELIIERLPRTLEVIAAAAVFAVVISIPLGLAAARRRGSMLDIALGAIASTIIALPTFVKGTLLILVFGETLRWVSIGGFVPFSVNPLSHLGYLVLPSLSVGLGLTAITFRMTRTTILETMGKEWVKTAYAKGLKDRHVWYRHVVRNSLTPVLTILGLQMGSLLGGTVVVEYIFNWPGLSNALIQAVEQRDYPEVQGIVITISLLFVLLNFAVDMLYGLLDPRVRLT